MATGEAAAWRLRDPHFGELRAYREERLVVAMEYASTGPRWWELRDAWLKFRQRSILDALGVGLLRYAALNWKHPKLEVGDQPRAMQTAAIWIIDLADAYRAIGEAVGNDIDLFWNPLIHIDLDERPRLAFRADPVPTEELAPELLEKKPRWDERTLVYQIGQLMRGLATFEEGCEAHDMIAMCLEKKPSRRFKSLDQLVYSAEKRLKVDAAVVRDDRRSVAFRHLEEALGWLELDENDRALESLDRFAIATADGVVNKAHAEIARWGATIAEEGTDASRQRVAIPALTASAADVPALLEEAAGALRHGDTGYAASLARDALTHGPDNREALRVLAEAYLRTGRHQEALKLVERPTDDAMFHYLRGKILIAMGRHDDARDAFDSALVLAPTMVEAMLVRREVVRTMSATRGAVGDQAPRTVDIPASLAELRDVLLSGDAKRAIAVLGEPKFADDADAQLVLARFHVFDGDNYRAAHTYDAVASRWPERRFEALLGKASSLLDFGYHQSALAMFDQLVAEKPTDLDASEGRARALDKLGRTGEAAAEFRRFVSLATSGSDLRVRVAQAWLDAHSL